MCSEVTLSSGQWACATWPDGYSWECVGITNEEYKNIAQQRRTGKGGVHATSSKTRKSTISVYKVNDTKEGVKLVVREAFDDKSKGKGQVGQLILGHDADDKYEGALKVVVMLVDRYASGEISKEDFNAQKYQAIGEANPSGRTKAGGKANAGGKAKAKAGTSGTTEGDEGPKAGGKAKAKAKADGKASPSGKAKAGGKAKAKAKADGNKSPSGKAKAKADADETGAGGKEKTGGRAKAGTTHKIADTIEEFSDIEVLPDHNRVSDDESPDGF